MVRIRNQVGSRLVRGHVCISPEPPSCDRETRDGAVAPARGGAALSDEGPEWIGRRH